MAAQLLEGDSGAEIATLAAPIESLAEALAARGLTVQDVEDALRRQNLEVPAGRIESRQREFSVTARTDLNTVAQFYEIALKTAGGWRHT